MHPVLFYGVPQGCSFGSIVALEWLGHPYQLCRIEMLEQPWPADYARINPLMKTPALLLENGTALSESTAILLHLAARGLDRQLGFAQGTPQFDRLNQLLGYLTTDFFSAFSPLWAVYEMPDADEASRALLRQMGRDEVATALAHIEALLADGRQWLLGGTQRTVADAYFVGLARWAEYHRLFDLAQAYPRLARYLAALRADPAVQFAQAIERGEHPAGAGHFQGHVTLAALRERLPG
ncbi:glutathione S-transferase family protein [Chitiniphilus purpureus]|uniref:Glutathione S-transferase family protein n=1 Tax=Chitiniphilus purpureus TaxID=2981137 RepID=A0ABY6DQ79_9NEIS|nr:glutathione S-transferase family protein [Chitiniphilus sp. CD1]UXY14068.1 glutathione S-transferase family protein [Chitiniphilus sp. CD1]